MSRRALAVGVLCAAAASGCGDRRTPPPDIGRPANPVSFSRAIFPTQGVIFRGPTNWLLIHGYPPEVATIHDGQAFVAIWRYPRVEPLPATTTELRADIPALLRAVRARDRTFALLSARPTTLDRHPAISIEGFETIAGQPLQVRSVHTFYNHAEVVLDSFAPPSDFARIDRLVFTPLLRSVRLRPPSTTATPPTPATPSTTATPPSPAPPHG